MMKKGFLIIAISAFIISAPACIKDKGCQNKTVQSEQAAMLAYASGNGISAVAHSSGIYYEIISQGSGATPNINSKIFVTYTGKLTDGTTFDSGTTPPGGWVLGGLIPGWQSGLPLINKGGRIKLIIPSSLGYGCAGYGSIPGNAVLYFDITLNDVQ
jgi:FKBP-type peptidyl-prolyl cis-trans isomerase FkpA